MLLERKYIDINPIKCNVYSKQYSIWRLYLGKSLLSYFDNSLWLRQSKYCCMAATICQHFTNGKEQFLQHKSRKKTDAISLLLKSWEGCWTKLSNKWLHIWWYCNCITGEYVQNHSSRLVYFNLGLHNILHTDDFKMK